MFMHRIVCGVLVLLLACPALRAQGDPKTDAKPPSAAEQYQTLLKEYQALQKTYQDASRNAKTPEEQQKVFREKYPQKSTLAPKFVALAEKNPKTSVALDALLWVVNDNINFSGANKAKVQAIALLTRDFIESDKLASACKSIANGNDRQDESFLRAVMDKSPHRSVQAEACLALAKRLGQRADLVARLQAHPEMAKQYESYYGKEYVAEVMKADLSKIETEAAHYFQEFADKHVAQMKEPQLVSLCQTLSYSGGKGGDVLLRALLEKDMRRDVQGVACLALGQVLKQRAERMSTAQAKEAEQIRVESEALLERAADKFGVVKTAFGRTIGIKAKAELFDLRHLSVGKVAPEVAGVDQDGIKFSLADYKGKVVLLAFWSQY